jgi:STE24 endopeptidase
VKLWRLKVVNWFLVVFAVFYLAEHAAGLWLTFLNLWHIQLHVREVPSYFREKISLEEYQQSVRYTHDKAHLGILGSLVGIPLFWGLLLTGFFGRADDWARSLGLCSILTGLIFLALMGGLFYLFSLPFNLYLTFVIEKKYGFNRTTFKIWITDLLKGLVLLILVMGPLLAAILWLMEHFLKGFWWLYVWALVALFQFFVAALFPVLILPIFNKLTPLPEGSLRRGIDELARKVSFRISGIFTMDGSKRSTHSNAFFAGIGKFRRVVLFDTLVSVLNECEVLAVLAHEMGHNVKKHVRTGLIVSLGSSLLGLGVLSQMVQSRWYYEAFGFGSYSPYAALFIFSKVSGAFTFFLLPLFSMLSRKHEYDADRFAAIAIGDTQPMIQSLVKLSIDNLSNLTPHPLYSFFYYSHPTTMERIKALKKGA